MNAAMVKLIAFYLPQFHPIPENDRWWGRGFTEWTNVSRAKPLFPGHHQPQLPADLGFYDLRLPEARQAQADLAREYGIHGFCYYHYWFNGKHLLERPFNEVLTSGQPDFPFCLCWANENWTRRWDGAEQEVLISQNYGDDDDRQHIQWLIQAFRDPRYIRIDGKPLILIYRARHLPNSKRTLDIWRREARLAGIQDLFIARVENFANERDDPHALGFDASVDFQPDWKALTDDHPQVELPDGHVVVDYRALLEAQLARPEPKHKRFPGVTPAWDNSARRKKKAFILADSSPQAYGYWLEEVVRRAMSQPAEERIVFVNAWNEWAEGNHLEPDQKFGLAYLEATRDVLTRVASGDTLMVQEPPRLPLTLDGFVTSSYFQDWLKVRTVGKSEAASFDRLFASKPAPQLTLLLDATGPVGADQSGLAATLQSVAAQQYPFWRLRVFANCPPPAGLSSPKVDWLTVSEGAWPNCALPELTEHSHDWYLDLRSGERLSSHALLMIGAEIANNPNRLLVATDGDEIDESGQPLRTIPMSGLHLRQLRSRPDWPGLVAARGGLWRAAMEDAFATDLSLLRPALILRVLERRVASELTHCPIIGLHRPVSRPRPTTAEAAAKLVAAHLERLGVLAGIASGLSLHTQRVIPQYPGGKLPSAAILLAHTDNPHVLQQSVETLLAQTAGLPFVLRIALPEDASSGYRQFVSGLASLALPNLQVVECPADSQWALANRLAESTTEDVLVFLDPHCLPLASDWLDTLARLASQADIGAVGGRVVDMRGAIHTAFIRLGLVGRAASPYVGMSAGVAGVADELQIEQSTAAVSGLCLAVRRETFVANGPFRAAVYPQQYADIDFCLRLLQAGLENVWTPFATLGSTLPCSLADPDAPLVQADLQLLNDWLPAIAKDPWFNPQIARRHTTPTLESDLSLSWQAMPWRPLPKIYVHPADVMGCGEVRIRAPMKHLRAAGKAEIGGGYRQLYVGQMAALAPESVVLQRPYTDVGLSYLRLLKAYLKTCLIYELDDLITRIPKENATWSGFPPDIASRVADGMGLCDRLLVSTAPLAEAYRRHCPEVRVLPNYLDGEAWGKLSVLRRDSGKVRVGWAGSASHGGDLALIEDCVKRTANEVDWVFLGFCPPELGRYAKEVHPPVPVNEYPAALAKLGLDLAVAPLAANAFNEAKSNLKLLEYGALAYPVICSNILPYQGDLAAMRVSNRPQDWLAAVRDCIHDMDQTRRLGAQLHEQVWTRWLLADHLDEWLAAWRA